jgi:hypothetical protein
VAVNTVAVAVQQAWRRPHCVEAAAFGFARAAAKKFAVASSSTPLCIDDRLYDCFALKSVPMQSERNGECCFS